MTVEFFQTPFGFWLGLVSFVVWLASMVGIVWIGSAVVFEKCLHVPYPGDPDYKAGNTQDLRDSNQ